MNHKGALSLGRTSLRCTGLVLLLVLLGTTHLFAVSPDIVISQIYGAGGNSGAPYNADYIELFNRGGSTVSLAGWSLQYASATGTGNFGATATQLTELPNVSLAPGQYFLVQEGGGSSGVALSADFIDPTPIAMSASAGKVALVMSNVSLGCNGSSTPCSTAQLALIKDLVGYGGANFYETAPTGALGTFSAALRTGFGCNDTDNNSVDFVVVSPGPRNMSEAPNPCQSSTNPTGVGSATVNPVNPGQSTTLRVSVAPGQTPTSTGIAVKANLSAIGGSTSQAFNDDGGNVFSYTITIPSNQPEGSVALSATITDAQGRNGTAIISLTVNAAPPQEVAIHFLQGSGNKAPADYLNNKVTTSGIVTAVKSNGFFIQVPDNAVDSDPQTSEGIYVFTSSAPPAAIAIGNQVTVTGTLVEYPSDPKVESLTEITSPSVTLLSTGNTLPAPVTINAADTNPAGALNQLERFESMRVRFDSLTTTSGTGGSASNGSAGQNETNAAGASNGLFFAVVTGIDRPFREPGLQPGIALPPTQPANTPVWDGNPELLRVDSDALVSAPAMEVTSNVAITNLVGVLDFGSTFYTVDPDPNSPHVVGTLMTATPISVTGDREFTVASFNMQRFYDTTDDPGGDTQLSPAGFERRLKKASLTIRNVLRYPDVIGVAEVEKLSTLEAIAARVSADAVAAGDPDPQYAAYLELGNDPSKINVGVLLKAGRVEHVSHEQLGPTATFVDPRDGSVDLLNDRPSLIVHVKMHPPVGQPFPVTVVVNHLRSLSDVDTVGGAGDYARAKRFYQAQMLAQALQQMQANGERIVSVGDYNAFQFNDGYIDVIGAILGNPAPIDQVLLHLDDYVDPDLTDLVSTLPASQQYSYVENGSAQTLDHIIVSNDMLSRNFRLEVARNNADFPVSYRNYDNRSERISDHDVPVAFFTFPPPSADLTIAMSAADPSVLSGHLQTYTITVTNNGPDQAANATMIDVVPANTTFYSLTSAAGWTCTTPTVGGIGQVSCSTTNLAAATSAQFTLSVLVNCATADATPLTNVAGVTSDYVDPNTADNTASSTTSISNPPPVISGLAVDRTTLWPPNHKMIPVTLSYSITDNCDTGLLPVVSVSSDQPLNGIGDGNTATDWQVVDAHHLLLRAERAPTEAGRTYTITVRTADSAGNAASGSVSVNVPR